MPITVHERRAGGRDTSVAILLLCAGRSSRMGVGMPHKLLSEFDGQPLVRRSALAAQNSVASWVFAVTGFRHEAIEKVLQGLRVTHVFNSDFASGMASSIAAGWSVAHDRGAEGYLVLPADMPFISTGDLDRLIGAFKVANGAAIIRAVGEGRPGNPVIFPRSLTSSILRLRGDIGARALIDNSGLAVIEVDIGKGAHIDVDTPAAVIAAGGKIHSLPSQ